MAGTTIELEHLLNPDTLAVEIANRWLSGAICVRSG